MHTFSQKLILCILAGFAAACLIQFYRVFVLQADESINKGYRSNYGISSDR